jgi:signal transduction histidine kinase
MGGKPGTSDFPDPFHPLGVDEADERLTCCFSLSNAQPVQPGRKCSKMNQGFLASEECIQLRNQEKSSGMSKQLKLAAHRPVANPAPLLDRLLSAVSRHHTAFLFFVVCCAVGVAGGFVVRDLTAANAEAQEMYTVSVHGLQRIGQLQYDAEETRRATLYALTTSDSNLQVIYAGQTREMDRRVKDGIGFYACQARRPAETALATRLSRDWTNYLGVRDEVLASILAGSTKQAVSLDLARGVPTFELVRQDLDEVKHLYDDDASKRQANFAASSRRSSARLIGILGFTFLLSSAAVWAIQRSRMQNTIQLAKLQMEFVASVSHELRTPLAVLRSAADNLADGVVQGTASLQKYGAILRHQSRNVGDLIDHILLFASTEDRSSRCTLQPLEISPIIDAVVANAEGLVQEAGFTLDRRVEADLPAVMGDFSGISQCMHNLIGNAVKYAGSDRRVVLRAFAAPLQHGSGQELRISVADHGIGIDSSELVHIFDPFYRSPRVQAAQIHGTGIGLSLAKRLAESMGGKISVVSELHVGSTFTLHLQIAKGEDMQMAASI